MKPGRKYVQAVPSILMVFFLLLSSVQSSIVTAQGQGGVRREVNAESGKVSFIGSQTGQPLKAAQALGIPPGQRPENPGRALVQKYGREFGLQNPASELREKHSSRSDNGRLNVRYQQTYKDIPVLAGGLIVNTNDDGDLYSITGEVASNLNLSTEPAISAQDAQASALRLVARNYDGEAGDFASSTPELWVYDESLLTPSLRPASLVWRMEISSGNVERPIRELILINAQTGRVALNFNQVDTAWTASGRQGSESNAPALVPPAYPPPTPFGATRTTIDAHNDRSSGNDSTSCSNKDLTCTGGTDPDADAAHLYAGLVWAFYNEKHGRNSIDNGAAPGMTIISRVNYDSGYDNAYWDGTRMTYGDGYGFVYGDDVVGHELTHGVTEYESGLLYVYQSGAINESFSDVWGEYFDQTNGEATDTPAVKWLIGEDVTELGALRSMSNPPAFGDPDKLGSPLFYKGEGDNGGVHINSGVNNKAVYLMVDGGAFNGKTVSGIGWDKTAAVYYEAQTNLLGSGSNYSDLYYALQQACSTLIGGAKGITLDNCVNVKLALDAVQMNNTVATKTQATAPLCPTGQVANEPVLFEDDMEGTLTNNWNLTSARWQSSTDIASSPTKSMWGNDFDIFLLEDASMKNGVLIPANTYLHFTHGYDFDFFGTTYYDGGVLEYSKNGGAWQDAEPLFSAGAGYGGNIVPASAYGNQLGGRRGFVGTTFYYDPYDPSYSPNMVSSRYSLASLAGQTVRFRFRFATDDQVEFDGWYIDDVKIYTCTATPGVPVLQLPANDALLTTYTPTLDWADSTPAVDNYQLQISTSNTFATTVVDLTNLAVSQYVVPGPGLDENTKYYWRVRAFAEGVTNNWSAVRSFRTILLAPVPVSPANGSSPNTLRPTFTWTNPNNNGPAPTSYTIQVSTDNGFAAIVHTGTAATTSYTPLVNLPANDQLFWRVKANGTNGPSANSSALMSFFTPVTAPPAPTLLTPATGILTTSYQPTFTWSVGTLPPGTTADHFQIQIDNDLNFGSPEVNDSTAVVPSFTPSSPLSSNAKLYWRVRTYNNLGEISSWSSVRNIRTAILPPTLVSPADNVTVNSLRPTFDWNDVTGATGYTIQISKNDAFTMIINTGNTTVSTYTPTVDLPKATPLFWRVQTKGLNGPSAFAPAVAADRSFNTPVNPPLPPTLVAPVSGALTTDYSPALSWSMPATSSAYDHFVVQVDNNLDFSSPEEEDSAVVSSPFSPSPDLASNTKFYWRVRAVNAGGEMGNWSSVRNFRTAILPPTLVSPADNATVNSLRPTFDWNDVTGATGYTIQISKNDAFTMIVHTGNPIGSSYIPTVDLPKATPLFWRVQTKGLNGPSAFTPAVAADRTFTTPANPPAPPTLLSPASNALMLDYTPSLSWSMPATSSAYDHFVVQVDNNADFSSPEVNNSAVPTSPFTTPTLSSNTKFYWRVRAVNAGGEMGNWSAVRYFRTALDVPVLQAPSNGYLLNTYWPLFNWADVPGAAGYNIQISWNIQFTQIVTNATTTTSVYQSMNGFCSSTLYWRVRATGTNGPGNWSTIYSFSVPSCP